MSTELALSTQAGGLVAEAVARRAMMIEFTRQCLTEGDDYGVIPGTNKKTLLKPGAEKLCTLFSLVPTFDLVASVEDWTGRDHDGEPFFYYLYRCRLLRNDAPIAEGDGSCNSWEKKYRYRTGERTCPVCGSATVFMAKEKADGFFCWQKKGGCGRKFAPGTDEFAALKDAVNRVPNPDIFDQVNTLQKMAAKRALVAATLIAVNASEFFTQDLEDFAPAHKEPAPPPPPGVDETTGEIVDEAALAESQKPAPDAPKPLSMQEIGAQVKERLGKLGYIGKTVPFLIRLLGGVPKEWNKTTYMIALRKPLAEWELIAESFAQEAHQQETADADAIPDPARYDALFAACLEGDVPTDAWTSPDNLLFRCFATHLEEMQEKFAAKLEGKATTTRTAWLLAELDAMLAFWQAWKQENLTVVI